MKTVLTIGLAISLAVVNALAQGPLTPPGAPAPTMKTLQQVEPRTPITNATAVTISQSGSYYLTTNITVATGDAITITADNVTLDLNGFTVSSTAPSGTGTGILLSGTRAHIHILNGHIRGNVTYSGGVYSGAGFANGIYHTSVPRNVRVVGVSVSGCQDAGIYLSTIGATVAESCTVQTVGNYGIYATTVTRSTAVQCGGNAIIAENASDTYGHSSGSGVGLQATTANNCTGIGSSNVGLWADTASNCYGTSVSENGLFAYSAANNCFGYTSSGSCGLYSEDVATGCRGYCLSGSGKGLYASTANNCHGISVSGNGLHAMTANNCVGASLGSGTGLYADYAATSCYGLSNTGTGLNTVTALNCYGMSGGSNNGLLTTTASNCYGKNTSTGNGLRATEVAVSCYGESASGTGLSTKIANSCAGTSISATYKYNMP